MRKLVHIYTDGACLGNPGPGGYGAIVDYRGHLRELSGGYRLTTNNRMEVLAAIKALRLLTEPCEVWLFSDSQYLVQAVTKNWITSWRARGWIKSDKQPVLNVDMWQELIAASEPHDVTYEWVRGHNGHPQNERCDALATAAAASVALEIDHGYEKVKAETKVQFLQLDGAVSRLD